MPLVSGAEVMNTLKKSRGSVAQTANTQAERTAIHAHAHAQPRSYTHTPTRTFHKDAHLYFAARRLAVG